MARGETIQRAAPAAIAARRERLEILVTERPSLLVSVLIALGFAIALFATLASFGIFGMLLSAPGDGNGAAWQKGFTTFIYTLAVGWAFASGTSLLLSLMRRPVAGLFAGMGLGLTAALVYVFMLR